MLYALVFFIVGLVQLNYSDQKTIDEKLHNSLVLKEDTEFADMIERAIKEGVIR